LIYVYNSEERRALETLKRIATRLMAEEAGENGRVDM